MRSVQNPNLQLPACSAPAQPLASDELCIPRNSHLLAGDQINMRSDRVYRAIERGMSRYEVCQIVAKGVKAMHKSGTRFEDSINSVLDQMSTASSVEAKPSDSKSLKPAA